MSVSELFLLHRSDRQVLLALLAVGLLCAGLLWFTGADDQTPPAAPQAQADTTALPADTAAGHRRQPYYAVPTQAAERFPFDPNTADSTQLLRLGLQPWQVRNIYKYRARGGIYRRKEDFARLYGLTVKQYRELEPYIRISADYRPAATLVADTPRTPRDTLRFPVKLTEGQTIDLCTADTALLMRVPGIGRHFADEIVRFRKRLGGFVSVSQLAEIEDFPMESAIFFTADSPQPVLLNLNTLSLAQLKRHPYINYYQAQAIIDYRRRHGALRSLDDLRLLRDFPPEALERLRPYVTF